MYSFKKGDKVLCIDDGGYSSLELGNVYTVYQSTISSVGIATDVYGGEYYDNDLFELVTEKENTVTTEKKPHKHRDLIIAWANGATIQTYLDIDYWCDDPYPEWDGEFVYRIKPEPKPDQSRTMFVELHPKLDNAFNKPNLKLTFDGETEKLKAVEIISE